MMASFLKEATAVDVVLGPFLDSVDGNTAETALTITQPDIRLSKNGGAFGQKSTAQTLTHGENGWYTVNLSTTDTNTLGVLIVAIHESGALPVWREFHVVTANVYDSLFSTDKLQVDVREWVTVAPNGLISGNLQVRVAAFDSNTITSSVIAAGAITAAGIATGAIDADALASDTITAAKIAADAITAGKIADGAIDAATFAAGAINAAAIAAGAIDDDAVAADMDAYAAKIWIIRDGSTTDRYGVGFFKNGQPVLSGITSPTIQVIKASDGTDLIAVTALTEIGSTGLFKKDEGTNKMTAGQMYFAKVQATIDGSTRTHTQQVGRDAA